MRLVHAPYTRELLAILVVSAVGLAASLIAAGGVDARPAQQTAVVPNGTYGAAKLARGEYVVFEVRNRRVRNLKFQIQITCETSDSPGVTEQRFFSLGALMGKHPDLSRRQTQDQLARAWQRPPRPRQRRTQIRRP